MSRYRAALTHLLLSAILVSSVVGLVYWIWYPGPTFEVAGAFSIVAMLIAVDLVVGPTLTLIVYKHGKPGLKFDLVSIALVQLIALGYGAYVLYEEKPHYMVFAVDRLEFVPSKNVDSTTMPFSESQTDKFADIIQVVARIPQETAEYQRYMNSVMDGMPDIESRPEYWLPWAQGAAIVRPKVKALDDIKPASEKERERMQQTIDRYIDEHPNLGVLPIGGIERDMGMLMDRDTLEVLDVINANPWIVGTD